MSNGTPRWDRLTCRVVHDPPRGAYTWAGRMTVTSNRSVIAAKAARSPNAFVSLYRYTSEYGHVSSTTPSLTGPYTAMLLVLIKRRTLAARAASANCCVAFTFIAYAVSRR